MSTLKSLLKNIPNEIFDEIEQLLVIQLWY